VSSLVSECGVFQPSNIFFAMDGSIKIGDFGLVTAIEENCCDNNYSSTQSPLLQDGRHTDQVGTKLYMSPEQVHVHSVLSRACFEFFPRGSGL